jgi:hypothetical protein
VLDAGDVALGSRSVAALASGATDTGSVTVTIPAGTTTGTYYVFAMADAGGVVGEVSGANNTAMRTLIGGPTSTSPPSACRRRQGARQHHHGERHDAQPGRRNRGGVNTRFYLSANNVLDAADVLLGARAVGFAGAGDPRARGRRRS